MVDIYTALENYQQKSGKLKFEVNKTQEVLPAIQGISIEINDEEILKFMQGLLEIFEKIQLFPPRNLTSTKLFNAFTRSGGSVALLVQDNLPEGMWEKYARSVKIKKNILAFYFLQIRRKILREVAAFFKEYPKGNYDLCPICGNLPSVAAIHQDEDGLRFLHCNECLHSWEYLRMKCPSCKETNHDAFQEYYVDNKKEKDAFIEVCNKCGGRVKTFTIGKNTSFNPVLKDAETMHLDIMLNEQLKEHVVPDKVKNAKQQ